MSFTKNPIGKASLLQGHRRRKCSELGDQGRRARHASGDSAGGLRIVVGSGGVRRVDSRPVGTGRGGEEEPWHH